MTFAGLIPSQGLSSTGVVDNSYKIARSLRFRSAGTRFNRAYAGMPASAKCTISFWMKRGLLGSPGISYVVSCYDGSSPVGSYIVFNSGTIDQLTFMLGGGSAYDCVTAAALRDPTAWYHIVLAIDTTQATASNRVKIYINGVLATLSVANYPPQNATHQFMYNNGNNQIGCVWNTGSYFDGYLADFYYIDNQQLDPTSFGQTDATNGMWIPKPYTGRCGNNGFYLDFKDNSSAAALGTDRNGMSNLLLWSDDFTNAYWSKLYCTVASVAQPDPYGGTGSYQFTSTNNTDQPTIASSGITSTAGQTYTWTIYAKGGTASQFQINLFWDGTDGCAAYYYLNNGTCSKIVGNGTVSITDVGNTWYKCSITTTMPTAKTLTCTMYIAGTPFSGVFMWLYRANLSIGPVIPNELQFTQGTAVANKNWVDYGHSVTAGVSNDSLADVPTGYADAVNGDRGNYATLNPLSINGASFSDGNLLIIAPSTWLTANSTIALPTSGKFKFEAKVTAAPYSPRGTGSAYGYMGVVPATSFNAGSPHVTLIGTSFAGSGFYCNYSGPVDSGFSPVLNDVITCEIDTTANTYRFFINGVSKINGTINGVGPYCFSVSNWSGSYDRLEANFGQRPWEYQTTAGFKALCTQNLPDPAIKFPKKYFDVNLWTGSSATQNIVNSGGLQPDLVWAKVRTGAGGGAHGIFDSSRGANKIISSNNAGIEISKTDELMSFNSDGFTLGGSVSGYSNLSGYTYVGWQWKKGTLPGFDIVLDTGTDVLHTIPHALGVKPELIIRKNRTSVAASDAWPVYDFRGSDKPLYLMYTNSEAAGNTIIWGAEPTSTNFSVSTWSGSNGGGATYVTYLFASVAGFSKVGSYVGNGSTDGPFVWCGFRPRWIMVKRLDVGNDWDVVDTARAPYNGAQATVFADLPAIETSGIDGAFDFLSNGFRLRSGTASNNASGGTYLYVTFAETPFKYARAR